MHAWLLLLPGLLLPPVALAQQVLPQPVFRCLGPDGSVLFSGTPCSDDSLARGAWPAPTSSSGAPPGLHLCPLDADQLRQRVGAAFIAQDVNRLAGLMLWDGYGMRGARARMQQWMRVMQAGLVAVTLAGTEPAEDFFAPTPTQPDVAGDASDAGNADPAALRVDLDDGQQLDFAIVQAHGCWWLRP